jgi:hypothetical protein
VSHVTQVAVTEKGDFGSGEADRAPVNRRMLATQPANAQPAHDDRTGCRGIADFRPVSPVSAIDASDIIGRRLKNAGGKLDGL